jgi:hypothetical protein
MELEDRSSRWGENFFNRHFVLNIGGGFKNTVFFRLRTNGQDECNYNIFPDASHQARSTGSIAIAIRSSRLAREKYSPLVGAPWPLIVLRMHGFRKITDAQTGRFACGFQWQMRLIQQLQNNKSPGLDRLTPEFYKTFQTTLILILEQLYNHFLPRGNDPNHAPRFNHINI